MFHILWKIITEDMVYMATNFRGRLALKVSQANGASTVAAFPKGPETHKGPGELPEIISTSPNFVEM